MVNPQVGGIMSEAPRQCSTSKGNSSPHVATVGDTRATAAAFAHFDKKAAAEVARRLDAAGPLDNGLFEAAARQIEREFRRWLVIEQINRLLPATRARRKEQR